MFESIIKYKEGAISPKVEKYGKQLYNLLKDIHERQLYNFIHERKSKATDIITEHILELCVKNSRGETAETVINLGTLLYSLNEHDLSYLIKIKELYYDESKGGAYTHTLIHQLILAVVKNYCVKHKISRISITIEDLSITAGDENEMIIRLSIAEEGQHGEEDIERTRI